jgi:chromosome segregation ATPase
LMLGPMYLCTQVDALSRKLQAAQRRLETEEEEVRRLSQESAAQRRNVGASASVIKTLEAKAAGSGEEAAIVRAKLAALERERVSGCFAGRACDRVSPVQ